MRDARIRESLQTATQHLPLLLTTRDVAELLRVSRRTIDYMAAKGTLPRVRVGGSVRFYRDDVVAIIDAGYRQNP